jgi:hypothetical protein
VPVVLTDLAKKWPAYNKWTWNYFKDIVGDKRVGIYNNTKSDAYTPVNKADDYVTFGEYVDMVSNGPAEWRIFLFNIFSHAPQLTKDFTWPENLMKGFVKRAPMLFVGGQTSITHMHFDIDMSHILHTQNNISSTESHSKYLALQISVIMIKTMANLITTNFRH